MSTEARRTPIPPKPATPPRPALPPDPPPPPSARFPDVRPPVDKDWLFTAPDPTTAGTTAPDNTSAPTAAPAASARLPNGRPAVVGGAGR